MPAEKHPSGRGLIQRAIKGLFGLAGLDVVDKNANRNILNNYKKLQTDIDALQNAHRVLQTAHDSIQGSHRDLQVNYDIVLNALQDLQRQETKLLALVPSAGQPEAAFTVVSRHVAKLIARNSELEAKHIDLVNIANEYQLKLERQPDYQNAMAQDQIRAGITNLEPEFIVLYEQCREFTMTSWERLYALYKSIHYIVGNKIPGNFVECGVWRGGSMRLAAMTLKALGDTGRTLYLYDTYEGMTEPDVERDIDLHGNVATNDWTEIKRRGVKWSYAPIEEVRDTMAGSGYPMNKIVFVKGPVEQTIPGTLPGNTALLRLDTDWYASTKQEIEHLYPLLVPNGVLALDDYGHYRGAQQAIDEYFERQETKPLFLRVDYACRFVIKPALSKA